MADSDMLNVALKGVVVELDGEKVGAPDPYRVL
jgi:hypothetical protein